MSNNSYTDGYPEVRLLAAAVGVFLLGAFVDLVSTGVGLQVGLYERNPLGVAALDAAGFTGLVGFKAGIMAATGVWTLVLWFLVDRRDLLLFIPAGIGSLWVLAGVWNATLVVRVVV